MAFDPNDYEVIHSPSSDLEVVAPPAKPARDFSFNPNDFEVISQPKPAFLPAVMGQPDPSQEPTTRISPSGNPEQWAREKAVYDQQWAAHKQWNDEHGVTTIGPMDPPDVAAGRAIQATVRPIQAGIQDLAETMHGNPTMRNMVAVSDNPEGAPTPFEEDTKDVTGYAKHLKNLSQAVPDLAVRGAVGAVAGRLIGAGSLAAPATEATAANVGRLSRFTTPAAFGLQPEGFQPKDALILAAFGIGSSIAGDLGASLVKKGLLAEGSTLTQKVIEMTGGQLAGDIATLTADLPELMKLSPAERKQRIIDTVIGNAAFLVLDIPHLKGSVKSHAQEELAKDSEWMADKISAHLDTQWAQQKATLLANPSARNDPNIIPGTRLQRTGEPQQPQGAPAVFRSGPFPGPEFEPQPQEANATDQVQQPPGGVPEHTGVPQGQNVPENSQQVRPGQGQQAGGGGSPVDTAKVPAQPNVNPTPAEVALLKENTIKRRLADGINHDDVKLTINGDPEVPGFGFVQVDEVHPEHGNTFSSNPEQMNQLGFNMPSTAELLALPPGQYTLPQAKEMLAKAKATPASVLPPDVKATIAQRLAGSMTGRTMEMSTADIADPNNPHLRHELDGAFGGKGPKGVTWQSLEKEGVVTITPNGDHFDVGVAKPSEVEQAKAPQTTSETKPPEAAVEQPKPPVPVSPKTDKAIAKVKEHVAEVSKASGPRTAKAIKEELVSRLEAALGNDSPEDNIVIDIPGDGTFTIHNNTVAISEVLRAAKLLNTASAGPSRMKAKSLRRRVSANDQVTFSTTDAIKLYGGLEEAYRRLNSQLNRSEELELDPQQTQHLAQVVERLRNSIEEPLKAAHARVSDMEDRLVFLKKEFGDKHKSVTSLERNLKAARNEEAAAKIKRDQAMGDNGITTETPAEPQPVTESAKSVEDIIKLAKDKQGHQGSLDLRETVKSSPDVTAVGLEELRAAIDHPDSGIPELSKQVIRALLEKPVMRDLDWSKLTVAMTDRIAGGFRGAAERSLGLITLSREAMSSETFPHEVAHFLYELLPERYRQAVEHWRLEAIQRRLNAFRDNMGELPPEVREVFHSIVSGETSDGFMAKLDAVRSAIGEDAFDLLYKMYPMINGSEFLAGFVGNKFAVNAFIARNKPRLVDRVKAKLQDWWDGLIETVRGVMGQDPSMNKVYNDLLEGKYLNTPKGGEAFERQLSPGEPPKKKSDEFEPTQIMGELEYVRSREHLTPESHEQSLKVAEDMFKAADIPVVAAPELGGWKIVDDGFDRNVEARKLADALEREIATEHAAGKSPDRLASMLNSIVLNFETGGLDHFDRGTRERLFNLSQSERSYRGALLGALARFGKSVEFVARNVDVVLQRIYSDSFGGAGIKSFMDRLVTSFRNYFTEAEIAEALDGRPEFEETLKRMQALNRRDEGDRVYRRVQGLLKPKGKKKLAALEADARVMEAVDKIIEDAKKQGIEPIKSPSKPLSPLNRLILMMTPETAKKINGLISRAVEDAEHNAGIKAALKDAGNDAARRDLEERFAAGEVPDPEMVEKGLLMPEFAHWKAIRDNLVDYSPTTVKLVQDLIKGDFKGVKFGKPAKPLVDTRIDLRKLAKAPEEEVRRVLDAHMANIENHMNISKADGATRNKIRGMIERDVADQLAARRKDVLESYFNPKKAAATLPSDRLKQLLNAGVARDPRFQTDKVRQLVKKIAGKYLVGEDMDALARDTRTEKKAWWERKTAEISAAEGFPRLDQSTRDYLEAVVRTHLAERLQAAEEGVTRGFLAGNDVVYDREPTTPEQRAQSLEDARSKLEGIMRAGGIDESMVEQVAGKSAVAKLTPKMGDLVKQIFETPFYRQSDLRENFADVMVKQFGIDPAQVDKAWEMFGQAFDKKQAVAKKKAFEQAKASLSDHPEEKKSFGEGRSVWEIVERAVNAGVFDSGDVLREIAKKRGMTPPTDAEVAKMKSLSEQEQRLRELTPAEKEGLSDEDLKKEIGDKAATTESARARLKKEMAVMWARLTRPIHIPLITDPLFAKASWEKWYHTRRNMAAAANEWASAELLLKVGFATRQTIGVMSQGATYTPTRAIGQALINWREAKGRGETTNLFKEIGTSLRDGYSQRTKALRATFYAIRASAMGRAEERNVERLMSGIAALDRMSAKADEYAANGDHARALLFRILSMQKLGFRAAQALDNLQGVPAEYQEMRYLVKRQLRANGKTEPEAEMTADWVIGDMKGQWLSAIDRTHASMVASGLDPTPAEVKENAWKLVRRWQYDRMLELKLPVDDFEGRARLLKDTIGYNERETKGIGGATARGMKLVSDLGERAGIPVLFGRFANAIGITINRALDFTPFYAQHDLGEGTSGWNATETDRMQRRVEAFGGTAIGTIVAGLVLSGAWAVRRQWPTNETERELWERQGHRPGTLEIPVGDGFIALSLNNSPITPLAPYLAGAGALVDLIARREKQQQALNDKAAKTGTKPGKIAPMDLADFMGVAGSAAYQAVMGGRTASGLLGSMTQYGMPNMAKLAASQVAPFIPGLPALQEVSRMMGVSLDAKSAGFLDFLLPLPTSAARKVNMLGDPVGTPNAIQRITQVLTGGSYPYVTSDAATETGYASLFASGYRPPSINPGRGYNVNGEMRPLNDTELEKYSVARGELFKQKLAEIGPTTDKKVVKAAFDAATAEALKTVGATSTAGPSTAGAPSGPAATGAASAVRARTGRSVVGRTRAGTSARLRRGGSGALGRIGKIRAIARPRLSRR